MQSPDLWHQPLDLSLVVAVNLSSQHDAMDTPRDDQHAQAALLEWINDTNPDTEDFFTAINSIEHTHLALGFSRWNLYGAIYHRSNLQADNPDYHRLQTAYLTYFTQNYNGHRTYGDGEVFTRTDVTQPEGLHKYQRCQSLAYSSGCPDVDKFIAETAAQASDPSSNLLPGAHNELDLSGHWLDVASSTYFRQNLLWLHIMGLIQNCGNTTLLHEILHGREELPDSAGNISWMPQPVNGKREVRFLARSEPFFGIVKPIWDRYDVHCRADNYELADMQFSQDLDIIASLASDCSSVAALAAGFQSAILPRTS